MDIVSQCRFRTSGFVWLTNTGAFAMTIIVKATFSLTPGQCTVAAEQEPIHDSDKLGTEAFAKSLYAPSDRVPYKPRADVLLVGHAYAPEKQPARWVTTRLVVGDRLDKSIDVWCARGFQIQTGQLLEGPRITKMPLTWEWTTGDAMNPVGMRFDAPPNGYGMIAIPHLQPAGVTIAKRSDTFAPIAYAPVAGTWPVRTQHLGQLAGSFPKDGWENQPMPAGVDPSYFQAAPPDQQIAPIRPDEQIVLENLHPEHARIVTSLPGLQPKAVVERGTGERVDMTLVADTLWIDGDRGVCCVVWRGCLIGLRNADEPGRIVVSVDGENAPVEELDADVLQSIPPPPVDEPAVAPPNVTETCAIGIDLSKLPGPAIPFTGADKPPAAAPSRPAITPGDNALPFPFVAGGAPGRPAQPVAPVVGLGTMFVPTMPAEAPSPPAAPLAMPAMAPAMPAMVAPVVSAPVAVPAIVPPTPVQSGVASPWAAGASTPSHSMPETIGTASVMANSPAPAPAASAPMPIPRIAPRVRTEPREMLKLLWFDSESVARIRRKKGFREVLAEMEDKSLDPEIDNPALEKDPANLEDRREIFEILARAPIADGEQIQESFSDAVREDGKFVPPLLLLAGELVFGFDELETLKATLTTVTPLVTPSDDLLRANIELAKEFLKTPGLLSGPLVAEGLTSRLRDAFAQGKRMVSTNYLAEQTERALLEHRHYQKRRVFGGAQLRAMLHVANSPQIVPTYLPAALAETLPMYQRFRARVIVEVHPQEDQSETNAVALRGLALLRVSTMPKK